MDERGEHGLAPREDEATAVDEALALAREALIAAHPEAVPELIGGATVAELRASVAAARAAYARVAERARARLASERTPMGAPAREGGEPTHLAALSPAAKIAAGLRGRGE